MSSEAPVRVRFAPSPTGYLHIGGARTALFNWLFARHHAGTLVLRIEDTDLERSTAEMVDGILQGMRWLGLDWDEGPDVGGPFAPYAQSQRGALYEAALAELARRDLVYLCDCSRAEVARVASAPHAGEEGPRYPGLCREQGMRERAWKRPPAVRLRVPPGPVTIHDRFQGELTQDVAQAVGDFVLKRGDGVYAYQLAVVVDDAAQGVTDVVRGADLLDSTARQIYLQQLLGYATPRYLHVPAAVNAAGEKLSKQTGALPIGSAQPETVLKRALVFLDQAPPETLGARELLDWARRNWHPERIPARRTLGEDAGVQTDSPPAPPAVA